MKHVFARLSLTVALLAFAGLGASGASAQIAQNAERTKIAGIDVVLYKTGVKDVVTFRGSLAAGDAFSPPDNPMIATLVAGLLDKGTTKQDKFAITEKLESVGATLSFSAGSHMLEFSGKCLAKDVPLIVSLIAEQLRSPAFSPEEFEKQKKQLIGGYQRALESTDFRATAAFSQAVYPAGHPNYQPPIDELIKAIEAAKLDDVKAFHATHYGPAQATMVVVGDINPAGVKAEITKAFTGWTGGKPVTPTPKVAPLDTAREQTVFMPDKTSVNVVLGQATGLKYGDPDYFALRTATAILGSGFTGRLMANVRDKEGLTYGIGSSLANDTFTDGEWKITATFAPNLLDKGIDSAKRQLTSWYDAGVTADELERRKSNLVGSYKVNLATTDGMANQLLATLHRGYDVSFMDEYPAKIETLQLGEVNGAIKKHLKPDNFVLIKAGTVQGALPDKK